MNRFGRPSRGDRSRRRYRRVRMNGHRYRLSPVEPRALRFGRRIGRCRRLRFRSRSLTDGVPFSHPQRFGGVFLRRYARNRGRGKIGKPDYGETRPRFLKRGVRGSMRRFTSRESRREFAHPRRLGQMRFFSGRRALRILRTPSRILTRLRILTRVPSGRTVLGACARQAVSRMPSSRPSRVVRSGDAVFRIGRSFRTRPFGALRTRNIMSGVF